MKAGSWRTSLPLGLGALALVGAGAILLMGLAGHGCGRSPLDPLPRMGQGAGGVAGSALGPPPAPGVRFAVIGDYGADTPAEARIARLVAGWNPEFVITTGDNNYPVGAAETIDANIGKHYGAFIGAYRGAYGPGSAGGNRFWPSLGNHDWAAPQLAPYLAYFTLPGNERYYDVEPAPGVVHLYALDSDPREPDGFTADSRQAAWLRERLAASKACFDVVYFHHPPYSSSSVHGSSTYMRWPFEAWGADLVVAGHDHIYERLQVGGIPYFVVGVSGASLYGFSLFNIQAESRFRYNSDYGAMLVTADRQGLMFQFADGNGTIVDSSRHAKPCPAAPAR